MCGFRVRASFLLICILCQTGRYQAMNNLNDVASTLKSAELQVRRTSNEQKPVINLSTLRESVLANVDNNALEFEPHDIPTRTNDVTNPQECFRKTVDKINLWRSNFRNTMDFQEEVYKYIEKKIVKIEKSFGHLSTIVAGTTSDSEKEINGLNYQYWRDILESAAKIEKMVNNSFPKNIQPSFLIQDWSEIMMEFLINTQKMQIISNKNLAQFLNKDNCGQVLLSYLLNKFVHEVPHPNLPFLNLNLRQSLQKSPKQNKMESLLTLLDEETWKLIEISYIRAELEIKKKYFSFNSQLELWNKLGTMFDSITSKETKDILVNELNDFLKQINTFISPGGIHHINPMELKMLYNMFCVFIRYHQQEALIKLLQEINHNSSVQRLIEGLEQVAQLLSSLNEREYGRLLSDHKRLIPNFLIGTIRDDEIKLLKKELE